MAASERGLSRSVAIALHKLQRHDGHFAPGTDPYGTGMGMANRYHGRFLSLGYMIGRCVEIVRPSEDAGSVLMDALEQLITVKRDIKHMVQTNVLLCNSPPSGKIPEVIDEVPIEKLCYAVQKALVQLRTTHTVRPYREDECPTPPVWRLDSLYGEFLKVAEDLVIDTYVFQTRDPAAVGTLIKQLTKCWLELRTLFAVRPGEK
jgi:hypothetical protein